jgi:hypothetical protein
MECPEPLANWVKEPVHCIKATQSVGTHIHIESGIVS